MELLANLCICIVIFSLISWVLSEDPATTKTPTSITPLVGDLIEKLCPRQELYRIQDITEEGMWLLPFCIDHKLICPPKWGTPPKNLVWVTKDEFNKHFKILHHG